ncbi:hypothetical protein SEVIR_1G331200v4 [Setaria viridis]|uniref:Uncharacterized protein n=1 Tax=Setaria viridis TaxID=4556 RepID=A0A4U6WIG9_SETVI|nr:hypothetical protein SEVIR_1G331200v2 [Setaria viridis]
MKSTSQKQVVKNSVQESCKARPLQPYSRCYPSVHLANRTAGWWNDSSPPLLPGIPTVHGSTEPRLVVPPPLLAIRATDAPDNHRRVLPVLVPNQSQAVGRPQPAGLRLAVAALCLLGALVRCGECACLESSRAQLSLKTDKAFIENSWCSA